ncbi:MAG: Ni/Fe hydrogenase subunit delta [Desulfurococcaceae archaeon]
MKLRLAVAKLASCSGCIIELVKCLVESSWLLEVYELGFFNLISDPADLSGHYDVAFIEGSASTREHVELVRELRSRAGLLVALGSCALQGGLQAAAPVEGAGASHKPVVELVEVDLALPGCPVSAEAVESLLAKYARGGLPIRLFESVCSECKRRGLPCLLVLGRSACLGPLTISGCGAICPSRGRGCYGCYGLKFFDLSKKSVEAFLSRLAELGFDAESAEFLVKAFSSREYSKLAGGTSAGREPRA